MKKLFNTIPSMAGKTIITPALNSIKKAKEGIRIVKNKAAQKEK